MQKQPIMTTPKGVITALTAFIIWGFFPLYFKLLTNYHAVEVIGHRIIWTFMVIFTFMIITNRWQWLTTLKQNPRWLFFSLLSGLIIATNWLTYVWAVQNNQILEASLGYFICPLVGVLLSLVVLAERLRPLQWVSVVLAILGVLVQLVILGKLPWVSLILALSFAIYGLMQRYNPLDALSVLLIETAFLVPIFIGWLSINPEIMSSQWSFWFSSQIFLLMFAGPITLIPLLMFNKATKMVAYNLLSFMNYLTPSFVFLLAIFLYREPFTIYSLITFGFIWLGLLFFSYDLWKNRRG